MKTDSKAPSSFPIPTDPRSQRRRVQVQFNEPSLTKQSFMEECDINVILRRNAEQGTLPELIKENPQYGDFSSPLDYQDSLNLVIHAQTQFEALSAEVRERFNNDPTKFLEFTSHPDSLPEMVRLGLATQHTQPSQKNDDSNDDKTLLNVPPKRAPKNNQKSESNSQNEE